MPSKLTEHGIFTRKEMAESLNVTIETLARYEEQNGFPCRRMGDTVLYDVEAIRKWITAKGR